MERGESLELEGCSRPVPPTSSSLNDRSKRRTPPSFPGMMKKPRRTLKRPSVMMAFAWYTPEQWRLLKEVADDRDQLDGSFEQWERNARRTFWDMRRTGVDIKKVYIDIERLREWCDQRGLSLDGEARSQYAIDELQRITASISHPSAAGSGTVETDD